jgi:hypothetical protein
MFDFVHSLIAQMRANAKADDNMYLSSQDRDNQAVLSRMAANGDVIEP